jgi:BirA family transcriptional regulator, biotin operon repressor / biotin---[acetyl-CoA-carboxylase] ligase
MDEQTLRKALAGVPLADIRYFPSTDSTNTKALEWAQTGAKEYSLVIAEAQTAGRGRLNRSWVTTPGSSLAFSLILFPNAEETKRLALFSPLGALAVC